MSSENTAAGPAGREDEKTGNVRRVGVPGAKPASGATKDVAGAGAKSAPEWANGLRQLYDSVIDEPIPDSFKDLLAQLNDDSK
ncbi:anti-sigma factor [Altererythrobacter sp. SALINAS58]|uniref:NepR family anti-sigma factor n=1 Tax=Alteripontixanthobacter muriae TaxID=2705546 RepID=UPI001575561B|nr:NepR family anti-sigma factor [Alteripontixanthobacter muriae]NTZ42908.1 anti-sigma factor [Alteripontixanthobacter muriae]